MPRVLAWDTETALIRPACLAPPLACVTWQRLGEPPRIVVAHEAYPIVRSWLLDPDLLLVGHNVAYDFAVISEQFPDLLPSIFDAYDADRVTDTMIRQQLLDIASGTYRGSVSAKGKRVEYRYDLESLARRCAKIRLQKDAWRLAYGEFIGLPLEAWPDKAREIQAAAPAKLADVRARAAALTSGRGTDKQRKALAKEAEGLQDMINGAPERCTEYPLEDAAATLAVHQAQEQHASFLKDQFRQARAAFALYLSSAWGLRTDVDGVALLRQTTQEALDELDEDLRAAGLVRADGSRDTKRAKGHMVEACQREGLSLIRSEGHFDAEARGLRVAEMAQLKEKPKCKDADGKPLDDGHPDCREHVCLDADACERVEDEIMHAYAERATLGKQLANDIPALEAGTIYPVHTRYGLAATGRSTSSKPNIQNQSKREGFREAFVPRPGHLFFECDFPGLELYTWAQCCKSWFGYSKLADALNAGLDPHLLLAAGLLNISDDDAAKNKKRADVRRGRQQSKPGNFGFAGGMGVEKFLTTTRKQLGRKAFAELGLDEVVGTLWNGKPRYRAHDLKDKWKERWSEAEPHFARVQALLGEDGFAPMVETLFTERFRGRATYCATANNGFQALGADCAKHAAWLIARAQYVGTPSQHWAGLRPGTLSPLYNTRTVAFVHDEFIGECLDNEHAHDVAYELAHLMIEGANKFLPDVSIPIEKMEPVLMRRWAKKAESRFDTNGRLVPWEPLTKE